MSGQPKKLIKSVKTKWKTAELHGKTVEFLILTDDESLADGVGHFVVTERADGSQEITITSPVDDIDDEDKQEDFKQVLDQRQADFIKKLPKNAEWDFQCYDPQLFEN